MTRTYEDPWRQYRYDRNQADEALAEATRLMVKAQLALECAIAEDAKNDLSRIPLVGFLDSPPTAGQVKRAVSVDALRKSISQSWAKLYLATNPARTV